MSECVFAIEPETSRLVGTLANVPRDASEKEIANLVETWQRRLGDDLVVTTSIASPGWGARPLTCEVTRRTGIFAFLRALLSWRSEPDAELAEAFAASQVVQLPTLARTRPGNAGAARQRAAPRRITAPPSRRL